MTKDKEPKEPVEQSEPVLREEAPPVFSGVGSGDQRAEVVASLDQRNPRYKHSFVSKATDAENLERRRMEIVRRRELYGEKCTNPDAPVLVRDDMVVRQTSPEASAAKDYGQKESYEMLRSALAESEDRKEMAEAIITRKRKKRTSGKLTNE